MVYTCLFFSWHCGQSFNRDIVQMCMCGNNISSALYLYSFYFWVVHIVLFTPQQKFTSDDDYKILLHCF